jgi:hypothetical protein
MVLRIRYKAAVGGQRYPAGWAKKLDQTPIWNLDFGHIAKTSIDGIEIDQALVILIANLDTHGSVTVDQMVRTIKLWPLLHAA